MRILIFSQYFWPETFRINEVSETLSDMGHKIEVITGKPNYPFGKLFKGYKLFSFDIHKYKKIKIHRVPIIPRGLKKPFRLALNYFSYILLASAYATIRFFKKKYDVIYIYGTSPILQAIPGIILGKLNGIPIVLNVQDLWPESLYATGYVKNKFILKVVDFIVEFIYKQCNLILVSSRPFKKIIREYKTNAKIKYFPNSVDPIFFDKKIVKTKDLNLKKGFNIIFAGNLGTAQSVKTIIGLAKGILKFRDINIYIFGDGSELGYMKEEKKQNKLNNLHLMGRYPLSSMPYIFSKADLLLATLTRFSCFSKTLPNKIQAYMTAKKPIVVSMNGEGAKVIKKAKCGRAAPAENVEKLIESVLEIFNMNSKDRSTLSDNAYKYFEKNFCHINLIKELENNLINLK